LHSDLGFIENALTDKRGIKMNRFGNWIEVDASVLVFADRCMMHPEDQWEYIVGHNGYMRDQHGRSYPVPKTTVWVEVRR